MSKPSIVIVPGAFTGPEVYTTLASILREQHGYEVIVGTLQSTSRTPPEKPATLQEDAAYFRGIIETLSSQGKEVVVVGHSYGGAVATQSVKSVTKPGRQAAVGGGGGGAVRVVYLATPVPEIGQTPFEAMGGYLGSFIKIMGDYMYIDSDIDPSLFWPGLPSNEASELMKQLRNHSTASFVDRLDYWAVDHIPVTYIHTAKDTVAPLAYQQAWVEKLKQRNANKVSTLTIDENHYSMSMAPEVTATAIVEAITQG